MGKRIKLMSKTKQNGFVAKIGVALTAMVVALAGLHFVVPPLVERSFNIHLEHDDYVIREPRDPVRVSSIAIVILSLGAFSCRRENLNGNISLQQSRQVHMTNI